MIERFHKIIEDKFSLLTKKSLGAILYLCLCTNKTYLTGIFILEDLYNDDKK
jgi:hypothetical protein